MFDFNEKSLDAVHIFKDLAPEQREELTKRCFWQRFSSQQQILNPENQDTSIYFITRGRIRVVNYGLNGKEVSFAEIPAGECFGELSAIDGRTRSAGVIAVEPTFVASLKADALMDVIRQYPEVGIALLKKLTRLVRDTSGRIMQLSTQSTYVRVYADMIRLIEQKLASYPEGLRPHRIVLSPSPTHMDIAARVSTTRETVARAFSVMVKGKMIRRIRGGIEILDIEALRKLHSEAVQD